jgi:hypothetical protein
MPVNDVLNALGSWDITLKPTAPPDLWDAIDFFGHVAFIPGRLDPAQYGDSLLDAARYVGVVRKRDNSGDDRRTKVIEQGYELGGVGMAMWLGDDEDKGDLYENAVSPASATFATAVTSLLPASGAVTAGTIHSVPGTYSGRHQYETPRKAITYVCETFSASTGQKVNWRVNGDGTLDAGFETDLFVTDPRCVISRKTAGKDTSGIESVPGAFGVSRDMEDFTTRVVLLAEGAGESIATGTADISPGLNPYKNIHGGSLKLTRLASESDTGVTLADTRAALLLEQYTASQDELVVETDNFYIEGSFNVGDYVWVWDPNAGLVDPDEEITFRGERLNPIKLQVTEAKWPITEGYTVAYRAADGTWYDLTDHVEWDSSHTVYVTVGGFARALEGSGSQPVGSRPSQDTSIPGQPTLITPFIGSAYLDSRGYTRARIILAWNAPLNVDGSTILDGDHYEIRYAVDADLIYPATWSQVSQISWADMETWSQPFVAPTGEWQTMFVAWGESTAQLNDLSPGVGYDVQIRAVDKAGNTGAWSNTATFVASEDNIPPSTPAAPEVAGSRIALQITHQLAKSSGGTFNLESDLQHLEIHVSYEPGFTPDDTTLKGKVNATAGMIQAQIPAVATVQVEEITTRYVRVVAVDKTGNKSGPSDAASATALLIDDAHISDLTVTKVSAGIISSDWLLGASIRTATTGARVELNEAGLQAYNEGGTQTVSINSADGSVAILGQLVSGTTGRRLEINPGVTLLPEIRFYADSGSDYGFINGFGTGAESLIGINSSVFDASGTSVYARAILGTGTSEFGVVRGDTQLRHGGYSRYTSSLFHSGYHATGTDGGQFRATSSNATIGWDDGTSSTANYMQFESGRTRHIGKWANYAAVSSTEGLFTGSIVNASAIAGMTISWGATLDSPMYPVAMLRDSPANYVYESATPSTTSAVLDFAITTTGASAVQFWCWRM